MARPRKLTPISLCVDTKRIGEDIAAYLFELFGERLKERQDEPDPLLLTVPVICARTGLGQTFIKGEIRQGRLRARKAGDRVVVPRQDFDRWVQSLRAIVPTTGKSDEDPHSVSVNGRTARDLRGPPG